MARRSWGTKRYVTAAERQRKADATLQKRSSDARPVRVVGRSRTIAGTFWGRAWCTNLESYSDYSNRLPRGRTYVRSGTVIDLQIEAGLIEAAVVGTHVYQVRIAIDPLPEKRWDSIKQACAGGVGSLQALLSGELTDQVMEVVTSKPEGLFPSPTEIQLGCSCPDWANMCKHIAATLYGTGVRLDTEPELLFTLRGVDPQELIGEDLEPLVGGPAQGEVLMEEDLSSMFGIDLALEDDEEQGDVVPPNEEPEFDETNPFAGIGVVLETIVRPGSFCGWGTEEVAPLLEVEGFGPLPLPVVPHVAEQLGPCSEVAPYGRGPDTLVDPEVRRARQIDATRVFVDPGWQQTLDGIVAEATEALGAEGQIWANLYKLLLYEPGDFFVRHRDTEKEPGMFATLVVVLPSRYGGGEVLVEHGGDEITVQAGGQRLTGVSWVAFYADCHHEIRPITEGVRMALVYNLVRTDAAPLRPADHSAAIDTIGRQLDAWAAVGQPTKLCVLLEHRYSQASMSWASLKGQDRGRAMALLAAAEGRGFVTHLALVGIEETWSAEEVSYRSRRYRPAAPDPNNVALYDLVEQACTVSEWRDPSDQPADRAALPFEDDEIWPQDGLRGAVPDSAEYYEATGNEGATVERAYRRVAVVLWPHANEIRILAQAGADALAKAMLAELGAPEPNADQADRLAGAFLDTVRPHSRWDSTGEAHEQFLRVVSAFRMATHARRYMTTYAGVHGVPKKAVSGFACMLKLLEPLEADDALAGVSLVHGFDRIALSAQILDRVTKGTSGDQWSIALWTILELLEDEGTRWRWHALDAEAMAALLRAVLRGAGEQADALLALAMGRPQCIPFDDVVLPAVLEMARDDEQAPAFEAWRSHCVRVLEDRTIVPPAPPTDLSRTPPADCRCEHCGELAEFLVDPGSEVLDYAAKKKTREHLQYVIRSEKLDLKWVTIRKGSPHTLRCTKTTARYEAAVLRYRWDLEVLGVL